MTGNVELINIEVTKTEPSGRYALLAEYRGTDPKVAASLLRALADKLDPKRPTLRTLEVQ